MKVQVRIAKNHTDVERNRSLGIEVEEQNEYATGGVRIEDVVLFYAVTETGPKGENEFRLELCNGQGLYVLAEQRVEKELKDRFHIDSDIWC
jgi:NADH:ubiquinone oxidoreductase subunit E